MSSQHRLPRLDVVVPIFDCGEVAIVSGGLRPQCIQARRKFVQRSKTRVPAADVSSAAKIALYDGLIGNGEDVDGIDFRVDLTEMM